jgi:hypothetical protein
MVNAKAKNCPNCGKPMRVKEPPPPKERGCGHLLLYGILGMVLLALLILLWT